MTQPRTRSIALLFLLLLVVILGGLIYYFSFYRSPETTPSNSTQNSNSDSPRTESSNIESEKIAPEGDLETLDDSIIVNNSIQTTPNGFELLHLVIAKRSEFGELNLFLKENSIYEDLQKPNFGSTVFVFENIQSDNSADFEIYIVEDFVFAIDFTEEFASVESTSGKLLQLKTENGILYVDGREVIFAQIEGTNGILYYIK